jgi:hypothetical protein
MVYVRVLDGGGMRRRGMQTLHHCAPVPIQSHPGVGVDVLFLTLKDDSDICCMLGLSSRGRSLGLK